MYERLKSSYRGNAKHLLGLLILAIASTTGFAERRNNSTYFLQLLMDGDFARAAGQGETILKGHVKTPEEQAHLLTALAVKFRMIHAVEERTQSSTTASRTDDPSSKGLRHPKSPLLMLNNSIALTLGAKTSDGTPLPTLGGPAILGAHTIPPAVQGWIDRVSDGIQATSELRTGFPKKVAKVRWLWRQEDQSEENPSELKLYESLAGSPQEKAKELGKILRTRGDPIRRHEATILLAALLHEGGMVVFVIERWNNS